VSQLRGFIAKLERLKTAFDLREFYAAHLDRWRERARRITVAILENARPVEADAETWRRRVAAESARLTGTLFVQADEVGVILSLGIRPPGTDSTDPGHYSIEGISVEEVERWVAAGRTKGSPEDPGKNLDERDAGKSDLQIAWRVIWSMKLRKNGWERLLGHIQEFLGATDEAAEASAQLYAALLEAWVAQLGPEIRQDFRDWFRLKVRQTMQSTI
jgi:hypothetical protein